MTAATAAPSNRLRSLDLLRGLAILLMICSGMLPKSLPNWVDHGYQPHYRPDATGAWVSALVNGAPVFDPRWKAFTWVDLVFPMFLFAMGAAIPFAMSRRLERGQTKAKAILTIAARAFTLGAFALIVTQMATWQLTWPDSTPDAARGRAMLGFVGTMLFFLRWKQPIVGWISRLLGAAILIAIVAVGVRRGARFTWSEADTIILLLAHTYFVAATLWVLTRDWGWLRLLAIAPFLLLAHYLQFLQPQWSDWRWLGDHPLSLAAPFTWISQHLSLAKWMPETVAEWSTQAKALVNFSPLWHVTWYKFAWCVIPGSIVGDMLYNRSTPPSDDRLPRRTLLALAFALTAASCIGLRHYGFPLFGFGGALATPWLTITLCLPLLIAMIVAAYRSTDPTVRSLMNVGATFIAIGVALSCLPNATAREGFFEGGISKGSPATLSYYALSVGLCVVLLLGLFVVYDDPNRAGRSSPSVVEANGQNPLLAYYLSHSVIGALLTFSLLSPMNAWFHQAVWLATLYGIAKTLLIAVIVWLLTRQRIVWRA